MKWLEEFSDPAAARGMLARIAATVTRPWAIMEVCGGQTHSIVRSGIDQLLPGAVELIHGPGCPLCTTPLPFEPIKVRTTPLSPKPVSTAPDAW